jgi:hypothetical protein
MASCVIANPIGTDLGTWESLLEDDLVVAIERSAVIKRAHIENPVGNRFWSTRTIPSHAYDV